MSQNTAQTPARTATADSYKRMFTFAATVTDMADYELLTITRRDNKTGTTTEVYATLATREALEEAVSAGQLHHNTPAYISASYALQGKFGSCY